MAAARSRNEAGLPPALEASLASALLPVARARAGAAGTSLEAGAGAAARLAVCAAVAASSIALLAAPTPGLADEPLWGALFASALLPAARSLL